MFAKERGPLLEAILGSGEGEGQTITELCDRLHCNETAIAVASSWLSVRGLDVVRYRRVVFVAVSAEEAALAQRQRDRRIARLVWRAFQTGDAIPPVSDDQEQMELTD